jgi:phospholipase D1/2
MIEASDFANPYGKLIDEGCQPRMPWQDVHVRIEGPAVVDIHRNFVRRWNATLKTSSTGFVLGERISKPWLEKIGGWKRLEAAQVGVKDGAQIQIVRSVSNAHLRDEGERPDDLMLFGTPLERELWKGRLKSWSDAHQDNILIAMANCIASADNYIYIETQFFISDFGTWSSKGFTSGKHGKAAAPEVDSRKIGNEDNGINNILLDALADRITEHIKADTPFHVYLVVPTHPEGLLSDGSVMKQHRMALLTIKHGSGSLINRIKRALQSKKRDPKEWNQYLTVLNMRSYGATVQYARDPKTFNEDFAREIGRFVVTEQIYIHSKLLIVDDAVSIIGSANSNDRSLTGNGDTEIAAVIVDTEGVELRDLGSPTRKVQTRKFARELRKKLWQKHFGFMVESVTAEKTNYFRSTDRAVRDRKPVISEIIHPPRIRSSDDGILEAGGASWSEILDRPCAPRVINAIQKIASKNAEAYERVFQHTPRNSMREFDLWKGFFTLPYPLSFDLIGSKLKDEYCVRPSILRLSETEKASNSLKRREMFQRSVQTAGRDPEYSGVTPPALMTDFMTVDLLPEHRAALTDPQFGRSLQCYEGGKVHNVSTAVAHLRAQVHGFFVLAPLDWGMQTKLEGNLSKHFTIDIAQLERAQTPSGRVGNEKV